MKRFVLSTLGALAVSAAAVLGGSGDLASAAPVPEAAPAAVEAASVAESSVFSLPSALVLQHTFGQSHTHWPGCTSTDCWTYMLANGTWHRGPFSKVQEQWGFVHTLCTTKSSAFSGGTSQSPYGWYIYGHSQQDQNFYQNYGCQFPKNSAGWPWSQIG